MDKLSLFAASLVAVLGPAAVGQSSTEVAKTYVDVASGATLSPAVNPVHPTSTSGGALGAQALTWYTSRLTFSTVVPGLCNKEDWEASLAAPVGVHNEPLWVCTNDGVMSTGDVEGGLTVRSSGGNQVVTLAAGLIGQPSKVCGANTFAEFTVLGFCNEPYAVGMDLFSNGAPPDPVEVRVFDTANVLLGQMTFGAGATTGTFAGVQATGGSGPIGKIEVESLTGNGELFDDLVWNGHCNPILGSNKTFVVSGDFMALAISEAVAPSRGLMYVTAFNGAPFSILIPGVLNVATGTLCIGPLAVPALPSGSTVGLNVFLIDAINGVTVTNQKTLTWQ